MLKLNTPGRDGTTHYVMSPLEFKQRLAALVSRPREPTAVTNAVKVIVLVSWNNEKKIKFYC